MIPPKESPQWLEVVDSNQEYHLSGLATKMLLMRVRLLTKNDPSKIPEAIDIAYDFFSKNQELVFRDIEKIFGTWTENK